MERIDAFVGTGARTKTDVIEMALQAGLDHLEHQELATGFALLADPQYQDLALPTEAQLEANRLVN